MHMPRSARVLSSIMYHGDHNCVFMLEKIDVICIPKEKQQYRYM
jgi:hypothetical protein